VRNATTARGSTRCSTRTSHSTHAGHAAAGIGCRRCLILLRGTKAALPVVQRCSNVMKCGTSHTVAQHTRNARCDVPDAKCMSSSHNKPVTACFETAEPCRAGASPCQLQQCGAMQQQQVMRVQLSTPQCADTSSKSSQECIGHARRLCRSHWQYMCSHLHDMCCRTSMHAL
jgi:hypothetical protein